MKKIFLGSAFILASYISTFGQVGARFYGDDVFKYYNTNNAFGSSRIQGMGGSNTALGGDISNISMNPAGLGFYNRNDFSLTPTNSIQNNTAAYIDIKTASNSNNYNLAQIGAVFSKPGAGTRKLRSAWGYSYNLLNNFDSEFNYSGLNKKSSITDHFANEATRLNDTPALYESADNFDKTTVTSKYPEGMYYWGHLIDPTYDAKKVLTGFASAEGGDVAQKGKVRETGALGQFNISYGANFDNRTYFGGSIGIQNLNYTQYFDHYEQFVKGLNIDHFTHSEQLIVKGTGINLTLGTIIKVSNDINVGLTVKTPTWLSVDESTFASIKNIGLKSGAAAIEYTTVNAAQNDLEYKITSPLKANAAVSYFLPNKIGVLNAEAEYIGYSNMNIKSEQLNDQKSGIEATYNDVVNIKLGGELRFGILRLRAGVNMLPSPIKTGFEYLGNKQVIPSVGLGIRKSNYYIDLSYKSNAKLISAYTPYTLNNTEDFASVAINKNTGVFALTLGTQFGR